MDMARERRALEALWSKEKDTETQYQDNFPAVPFCYGDYDQTLALTDMEVEDVE